MMNIENYASTMYKVLTPKRSLRITALMQRDKASLDTADVDALVRHLKAEMESGHSESELCSGIITLLGLTNLDLV